MNVTAVTGSQRPSDSRPPQQVSSSDPRRALSRNAHSALSVTSGGSNGYATGVTAIGGNSMLDEDAMDRAFLELDVDGRCVGLLHQLLRVSN